MIINNLSSNVAYTFYDIGCWSTVSKNSRMQGSVGPRQKARLSSTLPIGNYFVEVEVHKVKKHASVFFPHSISIVPSLSKGGFIVISHSEPDTPSSATAVSQISPVITNNSSSQAFYQFFESGTWPHVQKITKAVGTVPPGLTQKTNGGGSYIMGGTYYVEITENNIKKHASFIFPSAIMLQSTSKNSFDIVVQAAHTTTRPTFAPTSTSAGVVIINKLRTKANYQFFHSGKWPTVAKLARASGTLSPESSERSPGEFQDGTTYYLEVEANNVKKHTHYTYPAKLILVASNSKGGFEIASDDGADTPRGLKATPSPVPPLKMPTGRRQIRLRDLRAPGFDGSNTMDDFIRKPLPATGLLAKRIDIAADDDNIYMSASPPAVGATAAVQAAILDNDWDALDALSKKSTLSLKPIYSNISQYGDIAFDDVVDDNGNYLYSVSFSNTGTVWIYPTNVDPSYPAGQGLADTKTASHVNVGSYSSTAGYLGIANYLLQNTPLQMVLTVVTAAVASMLKSLLSSAAEWTVEAVLSLIGDALLDLGVEFTTVLAAGALVAGGLTFIAMSFLSIVFLLAVEFILTYFFPKYSLYVNIYNFDQNDWTTDNSIYYMQNASLDPTGYGPLVIDAFVPAGTTIGPPGFNPVVSIDNTLSYATYIYTTESILESVFTIGLQLETPAPTKKNLNPNYTNSFMTKYQIGGTNFDNNIGLIAGMMDMNTFITDPTTWLDQATVSVQTGSITTTAATNVLQDATNNVFVYNINIGNGVIPEPPSLKSRPTVVRRRL
jgi:hypothetical protein